MSVLARPEELAGPAAVKEVLALMATLTRQVLVAVQGLESVPPAAAKEMVDSGDWVLVDIRPANKFESAHPAGAKNVQLYRKVRRRGSSFSGGPTPCHDTCCGCAVPCQVISDCCAPLQDADASHA